MTEAMLRTLEFLAIEYDQLGAVRGPRSRQPQPVRRARQHLSRPATASGPRSPPRPKASFERLCAALDLKELLADRALRRQSGSGGEPRRARRHRRRRDRAADLGRAARAPRGARGRLLADLRRRRRVRRSAFHARARRSSAYPTSELGTSACNAWCRASRRPRARYCRPVPRSASTMTKSIVRLALPPTRSRGCDAPRSSEGERHEAPDRCRRRPFSSASRSARAAEVSNIVVGFPAGQATDIVARLIAERLGPILGETFIVENRPGQGGSIALAQLAKTAARRPHAGAGAAGLDGGQPASLQVGRLRNAEGLCAGDAGLATCRSCSWSIHRCR